MTTHSYSEERNPASPIIPIKISTVLEPDKVYDKTALLDTGSDVSCIPLKIAKELGMNPSSYEPLEGVSGKISELPIYDLNIIFNGKTYSNHIIYGFADEDYLLIGRDIMNEFHICFDGINLNVNIHENE